jgi:sugar lactone lactonase YvrE
VEYAAPTFDAPFQVVLGDSEDRSGLLEGVIWIHERGVLMHTELTFSGDYPSRLFEYTPGGASVELSRPFWLNGLAVAADGVVWGASYSPPGIAQVLPESQSLYASMTPSGSAFNSPNDLIVRADSNVYFTDPTHQLGDRTSETGYTGLYRIEPNGSVILEDSELLEPNGLALSPDEQLLYVGYGPVESGGVVVYDVDVDGALSGRRAFAAIGGTDGMTVDCAGNVYVVEHEEGLVHVLTPDGAELGTLDTPPKTGNLAFGGADRRTLYVTVSRALMSRPSTLPGYPY